MNRIIPCSFRCGRLLALSVAALCLVSASGAVFTIDPARSSITVSGNLLGFPFQEQAPGSLTARFEGFINANVNETAIAFTGASAIIPQNSGSWQPRANGESGSEPANYGGKAAVALLGSVVAAVRQARFDVTSVLLPISGDSLDAQALIFESLTNSPGSLDYSVSGLLAAKGSIALTGIATNRVATRATLTTSGGRQTLIIPVAAEFGFKVLKMRDTTLLLTGQLVATREIETEGSFENWSAAEFPGVADQAVIGPGADPDGDRIANLVEYAFGLKPGISNSSFSPLKATLIASAPDQRLFEFIRPAGLTGIRYEVMASNDLKTWTGLHLTPEIIRLGSNQERVVFRENGVSAGTSARFVLLTVSRN